MSWNRRKQRLGCLILLVVLALAGCQGPQPTSPSLVPPQAAPMATHTFATDLQGKVDFAGVRQVQSTTGDVVGSATVSFIDLTTNATVATGKTDAGGAFSLSLAGYPPEVGRYYLLEAIKGLSYQAPGSAAARFRTILQWSGTAWLSCTNDQANGPIVINTLTTALALESALDPINVPPSGTLGKVDATQTPAVLKATPTFTGHADTEIAQLAADLLAYLGAEADPVASVPSILPAITSLTPGAGSPNSLLRLIGTGFSPAPSGNVVTFNGLRAQVLLATPTSLVAVVPSGATTGPVQVQTGRGVALSAPFTVVASMLEAGAISLAGFSPTYGRADTVVTLSGEFGAGSATPSVTFTGSAGDRVPAPVLAWSPAAMTVTVPVGSVPGPITVRSGLASATTITSFDVWQGDISLMNDITSTSAGQTNTYPESIYGHSAATYGNPPRFHYVIGGYVAGAAGYNVRMYPVAADGTLGTVKWVARLNVARYYSSSIIVGDWLYVFGGYNNLGAGNYGGGTGPYLRSVERARINADGTLSNFTFLGDLMNQGRQQLRVVQKDNTLYALGGVNAAERKDYERFTVDPVTGSLTYVDIKTMTDPSGQFSNRDFGCQVVGNSIVMVGGFYNSAYSPKSLTLPFQADGTLATGSLGPSLNQGYYAPQSCVINQELYVFSGHNGTDYHGGVAHAPINTATGAILGPWVYDSTGMPYNVSYTDHPLVVGKLIYTIGGYGAGGTILAAEVMPDKSLSRWTVLGGTRENLYGYGTLMLGNRAWRIGGYSGATSAAVSTTEYYPIGENGSWGAPRYGPPLNSLRFFPATVTAGDFLYVLGGTNTGSSTNAMDTIERAAIDRSANTIGDFAYLPVRLNQPRVFPASAVIGPYLYVFGGHNGGAYVNSIERAQINSDGSLSTFEILPVTLPVTLAYNSAVIIGEYVYLVGGYTPSSPIPYVLRARISADGSIGAFTRTADMPYGAYGQCTMRIGNYLWAFGGYNGGNYSLAQRSLIRPDGTLGTWERPQPGARDILPAGASHFAGPAYVYKDWIFLASGYGNGTNVFQGTVR